MKEEAIWSVIYLIAGIAIYYFKKYRDKEFLKKKESYEKFLNDYEGSSKMEYNIRKTRLEMYQTYNKWLTVVKWFFWVGAVYILYMGLSKVIS